MKKNKSPEKGGKADFPDVKKIEKKIQTENQNKIIEVPDNDTGDKPNTPAPTEIPERKEEDEVDPPPASAFELKRRFGGRSNLPGLKSTNTQHLHYSPTDSSPAATYI
ncbi:MAG: hypothetical protein IT249_09140 [Chitinophagaceae bacterium]|nr:hypothetical protein [Chitinophagaceae bacterium]